MMEQVTNAYSDDRPLSETMIMKRQLRSNMEADHFGIARKIGLMWFKFAYRLST